MMPFTQVAITLGAAMILLMILVWRHKDDMNPIERFTIFALLDLTVMCLVLLMTPHLLTVAAVALGVIGGVYLGRAWEQVKLDRLLDALTTPDGGERR